MGDGIDRNGRIGPGREPGPPAGSRRGPGRVPAGLLRLLAAAAFVAAACAPASRVVSPAGPGGLVFSVRPAEARVFLDGVDRGEASLYTGRRVLEADGGTHRLELRLPGYETYSRDVFVSGGTVRVNAVLFPVPPPGSGY